MKQQTFEFLYQKDWQQLEHALIIAEEKRLPWQANKSALDPELPQLYRRICHHLSMAQERHYSSYLVAKLNDLVLRAHQQLYQRQNRFLYQLVTFIVFRFPNQFRQNINYFWVASLLFYLPGVIVYALVIYQPQMIYSVFDHLQVLQFESMYDPTSSHYGTDRQAQTDLQMFGHYIQNNISIGFQTFATGLFFGLGSIFYLVFNGLVFGAVSAHIVNIGYNNTFFPFVIGHGSFELTAITIAGAAGLMLGHSLINPGQYPRALALKFAASKALDLVYGITLMLLIAAFIEAFWSSNSALPLHIKYGVGACLWLLVFCYLAFAGKSHTIKVTP